MAKYKVVVDFTDKETKHVYRAGKEYPEIGKTATEARIKSLSTKDNRLKKSVISLVEEEKQEEPEIEEVEVKEDKSKETKSKAKAKK